VERPAIAALFPALKGGGRCLLLDAGANVDCRPSHLAQFAVMGEAYVRARLGVARRQLAARLVELYQADKPDLVTVILNAKGFADLLERQDFLERINEQDQQVVTLVKDAKADATSTARRLAVLRPASSA
jgi:hypothetical protein